MDIGHIFRILKIDVDTSSVLKKEGVKDAESLLEIEDELRNGEFRLKAVQQKRIIDYLDWSRAFEKEHNREPNPCVDFSKSVLTTYSWNAG